MNAGHDSRLKTIGSVVLLVLVLGIGLLMASTPALAQAPENDDIYEATILSGLPFVEAIDAMYATWDDATDPTDCSWWGYPTIWYEITPDDDMWLRASASRSEPIFGISAYSGSPGDLVSIGCVDYWSQPLVFKADAGKRYFIMIMVPPDFLGGFTLTFTLEEVTPPPNDDFNDASVVPAVPYLDMLDTVYASPDGDDPDSECFSYDATVWYAFTPTRNTRIAADLITVTGVNAYGAALGVYTGERGSLDELACADVYEEPVVFEVAAGTTYYFMVSTAAWYETGDLAFTLASSPANDDFGDATIVPELPYMDMLDTVYAGTAGDDPASDCVRYDATVWYAFTPTGKMRIAVDLIATTGVSTYNTFLGVYSGERGSVDELACTNLYAAPPLLVDVAAGETYYFLVSTAAWYEIGDLAFTVELDEVYLFLPFVVKP